MRLDCHIHSNVADAARADVAERMKAAGFDGGNLFSQSPSRGIREAPPAAERLEAVLRAAAGHHHLFPFYFLDPTEPDALEQVELAAQRGIRGFKVICSRHYPCDERAMPVYRRIAELNRPIMFHSGILYDGRNPSGNFNRPCNFEGLLQVDNLRFSLAHVSWPWTDECIAVYGKFNDAKKHHAAEGAGEMFIDLSPGTPPPYRRPMFDRLLFSGYDIWDNLLYGIDTSIGPYDTEYAKSVLARDEAIFDEYGLGDDFKEKLYWKNDLRFIGLPEEY